VRVKCIFSRKKKQNMQRPAPNIVKKTIVFTTLCAHKTG